MRFANDTLWNAIVQYGLTVGEYSLPGCEHAIESIERAKMARDVEQLRRKLGNVAEQYADMNDADALSILQELARKAGK